MNASPNLTFKQQRFVEEYQVDGNGYRLFFGQATRPTIRWKWLTDYLEILRSNIAFRMLRTPVESVCKCR